MVQKRIEVKNGHYFQVIESGRSKHAVDEVAITRIAAMDHVFAAIDDVCYDPRWTPAFLGPPPGICMLSHSLQGVVCYRYRRTDAQTHR